ncbi:MULTISPECIES: lipid IV(A) 4-amino-4-deoxy-L-arabinosyltransferase [Providencia]|uniref:lipid IV(A) 4-amino-4-deoxy-L-arabinosyltransferase n=1 Tax=Providencia TaxID=586 RepID=UPI00197CC402|nr:lipid IV(A) 4-amino-4-deoxy-L-arabinosyltransferase [Providencia sp. PROV252]MBN4866912.1 lipid IV(A) 4-amino-4-deoxy-L-arabinosyltransferase [Providencia stuartii]MBN4876184.1 lipid IV(A) 4-amino-4-deoxy-L-arabinosyltransferase [Providencia stuartii]MBN4880926.1 lipid IV(A) 4-amino-4-deoxy-L-arabinosyltransferase [Providencia stuartii]MBN4885434.1 lipid IV(A) 4-amino-4-deoxy-L-arabinosyltransferase [Providencia stuartii]HEM8294168.1 lipid IV(A) 4-amino-4-deoxy-L-arabinosyltransferase [Prov
MIMANNKIACLKWCLLFVFIVATYFLPLNGRLLWQPDELRYAEISRELIISYNWSVPELLDVRYFEKPIFGYWVGAIFQMLFGENNVSVRLGVVFSTLISGLFVYLSAKMAWKNPRIAFNATFIYLSMLMVFTIGTYNILDPIVTAFITMVIFFFQWGLTTKRFSHQLLAYILLGVACGLGVLTKGFLVLVLPVLVCSVAGIYFKKFKDVFVFSFVSIFTAFVVCLPWAFVIASREPDFWRYFFWVEHIQRFMADNAQNKSPFWFYIPIMMAAVLPWLGYLFGALRQAWQQKGMHFYFLLWFLAPFIFFSITKGKLLTYILPCIAPIAILMAAYIEKMLTEKKTLAIRANAVINMVIGGLAAGVIIASPYIPKINIYQADESYKLGLAAGAFIFWLVVAFISMKPRFWYLAAVCTVAISLSVGHVIPNYVASNNTPQKLVAKYSHQLENKSVLLTNNVGLGTALAWVLKRSDITMLHQTGELGYGLQYPDAANRFYRLSQLPALLESHQYKNVAVVVEGSQHELVDALPGNPIIIREGNLIFAFYEG